MVTFILARQSPEKTEGYPDQGRYLKPCEWGTKRSRKTHVYTEKKSYGGGAFADNNFQSLQTFESFKNDVRDRGEEERKERIQLQINVFLS